MKLFVFLLCVALLPIATPTLANDSVAELGTGGLILARSDVVVMEKEDLFLSLEEVRVDYVFRNTSDADVETIVAFPLPDIEANPYSLPAIPYMEDENFLDFEVTIDGSAIEPELELRAVAIGVDVTEELAAQGISPYPFGEGMLPALADLPDDVAADWLARGIITIDEYDDGSGWKRVRTPFWKLRSAYWWRASFPARRPVQVAHRYAPSVGATAGISFFFDGRIGGDLYPDYKRRYCIDQSFERALAKAAAQGQDGNPPLYENRLSYILKTGGNWAGGTIGDFTLTVDKDHPKNLVSFCGEGVEKIGPTTFRMKKTDFYPDRDLDVLILRHADHVDDAGSDQPRIKLKN